MGREQSATERVEARWHQLVQRYGLAESPAGALLAELIAAYAAPSRHYHNLDHIDAFQQSFRDGHAALIEAHGGNVLAFELAIALHDCIYDVTAKDNEERCAGLARQRLPALGVPEQTIGKAQRYIIASKHLTAAIANPPPDELLFADLDLAILAADTEVYARYTGNIRREYAIFPVADYARGRAHVLRRFLAEPRIFRAAGVLAVPADWEVVARRNLAAELADLTHGVLPV